MSKQMFMELREQELAELAEYKKPFIKNSAERVINLCLDGEIDPLKVKIACKTAIDYYSQIDKGVGEIAYTEAAKYGKSTEMLNAKVEVRSSPSSYEFSVDPVWSELKEKLKAREALLKTAATSKATMFDEEDGSEIPKVPINHGKDTVFITLK